MPTTGKASKELMKMTSPAKKALETVLQKNGRLVNSKNGLSSDVTVPCISNTKVEKCPCDKEGQNMAQRKSLEVTSVTAIQATQCASIDEGCSVGSATSDSRPEVIEIYSEESNTAQVHVNKQANNEQADSSEKQVNKSGAKAATKSKKRPARKQRKRKSDVYEGSDDEEALKMFKMSTTINAIKAVQRGVKGKGRQSAETSKKLQTFAGPYVHVEGKDDAATVFHVVNTASSDTKSYSKTVKELERFTPTVHTFVDCIPYSCAICGHVSNYHELGDLFGPYYPHNQVPSGHEHTEPTTVSQGKHKSRLSAESRSSSEQCASKSKTGKKPTNQQLSCVSSLTAVKEQLWRLASNTTASGLKASESWLCRGVGPSGLPVEVWVHEDCVVWAAGVYLSGPNLVGLEELLMHCKDVVCCVCKKTGAMMGCFSKSCPQAYHYLCARDGGCLLNKSNYTMFCPKHRVKKS